MISKMDNNAMIILMPLNSQSNAKLVAWRFTIEGARIKLKQL